MGTRRRRMRSRKHKMRKHRMQQRNLPPGYGIEYPPPYSAASQIEEYLTTIVTLQNKVTRLEDLLERTQQSCDKRINDSNTYIRRLESTIFNYQNSGIIPSQRRAYQPTLHFPRGLQLSPQDIAEMNAEAGSDLDRETSSDSDDDSFNLDDMGDNDDLVEAYPIGSPPPSPIYDP